MKHSIVLALFSLVVLNSRAWGQGFSDDVMQLVSARGQAASWALPVGVVFDAFGSNALSQKQLRFRVGLSGGEILNVTYVLPSTENSIGYLLSEPPPRDSARSSSRTSRPFAEAIAREAAAQGYEHVSESSVTFQEPTDLKNQRGSAIITAQDCSPQHRVHFTFDRYGIKTITIEPFRGYTDCEKRLQKAANPSP